MKPIDLEYFKRIYNTGVVKSPMLEMGSAKVQPELPTLSEFGKQLGVEKTFGVDLELGPGVDAVTDLSVPVETFKRTWAHGQFPTVAIFNVLEHTFEPTITLANALSCLAPGGVLIVVTPVIWEIHSWPADYNRMLPNWYEQFAKVHGLTLDPESFCWLNAFGITKVYDIRDARDKTLLAFPTAGSVGREAQPFRYFRSRVVNRLFNTFGRFHFFPHIAIGVTYRKPA